MPSETPRLTYVPARGRVEPLRILLAAANVKYEHNFLTEPEQIDELIKAGKLDYGQVPMLEMDGLNLVQTFSIMMYVAEKYDMLPTDPKVKQEILSIVYAANDAREPIVINPFAFDCNKEMLILKAPKALFDRYAPKWEEKLAKDTTGPFFLGSKVTIADTSVFEVLDGVRDLLGEEWLLSNFENFPNLLALHDAVLEVGGVKTYRDEERPSFFVDLPKLKPLVMKLLRMDE